MVSTPRAASSQTNGRQAKQASFGVRAEILILKAAYSPPAHFALCFTARAFKEKPRWT
jgi:hypothetical protein